MAYKDKNKRKNYMNIYRKTFRGMVSRMYEYMRSRCIKGNCCNPKLYLGKHVPPVCVFTEFASKNRTLKKLYKVWKDNEFSLKLRPTPDRQNTDRGYELDNIKFVTYSKNSSKSSKLKKKRKKKSDA